MPRKKPKPALDPEMIEKLRRLWPAGVRLNVDNSQAFRARFAGFSIIETDAEPQVRLALEMTQEAKPKTLSPQRKRNEELIAEAVREMTDQEAEHALDLVGSIKRNRR